MNDVDFKIVKKKGVTISVRLTEEERLAKAERASQLLAELAAKQEELKQLKSELSDEIKDIKGEINKASKAHTTGVEMRIVDCDEVYDLVERKIYFLYRSERYQEREMAQWEFDEKAQGTLFDRKTDELAMVTAQPEEDGVDPEVKEVIKGETKKRGRGKKDHTAKAKAEGEGAA